MTLLQKINTLTFFNLINKLKDVLLEVNNRVVPVQPSTGNYRLESVDGVLTWVLIE